MTMFQATVARSANPVLFHSKIGSRNCLRVFCQQLGVSDPSNARAQEPGIFVNPATVALARSAWIILCEWGNAHLHALVMGISEMEGSPGHRPLKRKCARNVAWLAIDPHWICSCRTVRVNRPRACIGPNRPQLATYEQTSVVP